MNYANFPRPYSRVPDNLSYFESQEQTLLVAIGQTDEGFDAWSAMMPAFRKMTAGGNRPCRAACVCVIIVARTNGYCGRR
jgi:hypothetical protein